MAQGRRRTSRRGTRTGSAGAGTGAGAASALDHVVAPPTPIKVKYARGKNHELLVSVNDAAKLAAVSRRTIYNWITAGKVEVQFAPSGTQRVVVKSIWRGADDVIVQEPSRATSQAYRDVETSV